MAPALPLFPCPINLTLRMISMPLALEPVTITVICLVGAAVVIGGLVWAFTASYHVKLSPSALSMPIYTGVTVSVSIERAGSVFSSWVPVAGNIIVVAGPSGILAPSNQNGACTAAAPFVVTVTGTRVGTDSVNFRGTAATGDNAGSMSVTLKVTGE